MLTPKAYILVSPCHMQLSACSFVHVSHIRGLAPTAGLQPAAAACLASARVVTIARLSLSFDFQPLENQAAPLSPTGHTTVSLPSSPAR